MIRLAAFDLDGTVLADAQMRPLVHDCLVNLRKTGFPVVVASGRHPTTVEPYIAQCFSMGTYTNGSLSLFGDGSIIDVRPIEKSVALDLFDYVHSLGGENLYFSTRKQVMNNRGIDIAIKAADSLNKPAMRAIWESLRVIRSQYIVEDVTEHLLSDNDTVVKLESNFSNWDALEKAYVYASETLGLEVAKMSHMSLEITPGGVSKATGLSSICKALGISSEEVVAFGDSSNDLEMLRWAGTSVVMANGDDEAKALSDIIAPSVYEDGVVTVLGQLGLI